MAFPRPSPSGGLSRQGRTTSSNFDQTMSKDDSFLSSRRAVLAPNNRLSRDDSYIRGHRAAMSNPHMPKPGPTIKPAHSPPEPLMQEAWSPACRWHTTVSITSGDIPIGVAWASLVQSSPDALRWQAQPQDPPVSPHKTGRSSMPASPAVIVTAPNGCAQKKKTARRKLFGLFGGGKKQAAAAEDGSRGGLSNLSKSVAGASTTVSVVAKTPTRSHTQRSNKRKPRHTARPGRSHTMPTSMEAHAPVLISLPFPMPRTPDPSVRQVNEHQARASPSLPAVPRLDVRIPDTKMERYSVMFSDVLRVNGSAKEPARPLLARRQATLERLKPINGSNSGFALEPVQEDERTRPRRTTSPTIGTHPQVAPAVAATPAYSSPRLSVFPVPTTARPTGSLSAPTSQFHFARSNTSPGRLSSPTDVAFARRRKAKPSKDTPTPSLEVPSPLGTNTPDSTKRSPRNQGPIYPTDTSFHFGPDQPGLVLDSPASMLVEEVIISQPSKPTLHEPQWQVFSPATAIAPPSGRHDRSRSVAGPGSAPAAKPSAELAAAAATDDAAALQSAVEVSIARQISISREQRNLLRPLHARRPADRAAVTTTSTTTAPRAPPPPLALLGSHEPIKETKSSTPTLVHRRGSPVDPRNRKSTRAVVETG